MTKILKLNYKKFMPTNENIVNLNQAQLQAMEFIDQTLILVNQIGETPPDMITPGQAREWINKLSSYICRLGTLEAEFESYYYRIMSKIRNISNSNADAETKAKGSDEYFVYRKIKNFRQDLYEKIQSTKRLINEEPDGRKDERHAERNCYQP